jgi:hypothetical protein
MEVNKIRTKGQINDKGTKTPKIRSYIFLITYLPFIGFVWLFLKYREIEGGEIFKALAAAFAL